MKNYPKDSLKIISLGGWAEVTKNLFVYETSDEILLVDCGIGFVDTIKGTQLVVPDLSYLKDKKHKIKGLVISHGHDDHVGGLPYLLPQLPKNLPVWGPRWAIGLARLKLEETRFNANLNEFNEKTQLKLGNFSLNFIKVTHSILDTYHLVIKTPVGLFYHAADFKLDLRPVIGQPTDQDKIVQVGKKGIFCLLSDCLRAEQPGFTPPEADLEKMFATEITDCRGKFFVTTMSSNISRFKQAVDVSLAQGRKIVLIGMSIEKSFKLARQLGYLKFPPETFIKRKKINRYSPDKLTLLVAGSQGQFGSSLDRIVAGEIPEVQIEPGDKIVFSTDYIPGNETAIYQLIDNIYRLGGEVVYRDIHSNVHVSGHGSQKDLAKLMEMVKPRWLIPIGGDYRHSVAYQKLAIKTGFKAEQVIIPDGGEVIGFTLAGNYAIKEEIQTRQVKVDQL